MSDPIRLTAYYKKMGKQQRRLSEMKNVDAEVVKVKHLNGNLFEVWFLSSLHGRTYFHFFAKDALDAFRRAKKYIDSNNVREKTGGASE